jgi:hypothetical protein
MNRPHPRLVVFVLLSGLAGIAFLVWGLNADGRYAVVLIIGGVGALAGVLLILGGGLYQARRGRGL